MSDMSKKRKASSQINWRNRKNQKDATDNTDFYKNFVGKEVLIDRVGARGKKFGYCKAKIISMDKGMFTCQYEDSSEIQEQFPVENVCDNSKRVVLIPGQ